VAFQLVPMFTMGEPSGRRWIWAGLLATQAGLVGLGVGVMTGIDAVAATGALVIASGIVASGIAMVATLQTRRRRILEPSIRAFLGGTAILPLVTVVGLVLLFSRSSTSERLPAIYGALAIVGALSLIVMGMLGKIVPFLVWMTAYGPKVGRGPVPAAPSLSSRECERAWLAAHVVGLTLAIAAMWIGSVNLAHVAAWVLTAGGALYIGNLVQVAWHLKRGRQLAPVAATLS
jgi:hypothetical protein